MEPNPFQMDLGAISFSLFHAQFKAERNFLGFIVHVFATIVCADHEGIWLKCKILKNLLSAGAVNCKMKISPNLNCACRIFGEMISWEPY